jgi:predicted MFS family arabinose efflux permease
MRKQYFVFAAAFFFALGGTILGFSLIYRLTDTFSFDPGQIGTFIALGQVAFFLGCNLYHRFGSALDPLRIFPVSSIAVFFASILLSASHVESIVYASYWIIQLGSGLFWPPVTAWLTHGLDNKDLNREMGYFNRSWMSANMCGPLIAGAVYSRSSVVNFFIIILCYFMVLLIFYFLRRHFQKQKDDDNAITAREFSALAVPSDIVSDAAAAPSTSADRYYSPVTRTIDVKLDIYRYRGWISGMSSAMFLGVLSNIVPLYIRDGLGHSEMSAGLLLFIRCVAGLVGFSLLAHLTAWHFNRRWFLYMQAGLILCSFLFILAGGQLLFFFIIVLVYGLLNSACYNNSMFYSGATGKNPKKNMALHEIFLCVGNAAGTAGGGFFYQRFGFGGTCLVLILVLGLGLATFVLLERRDSLRPYT